MTLEELELGSNEVICQKWSESERGWGTRPDGISLHDSFKTLEKYIKKYWDGMPDAVPSVYSMPDGTPYPIGVGERTYEAIIASKRGIRMHSEDMPGSGGIDGWLPQQPDFD